MGVFFPGPAKTLYYFQVLSFNINDSNYKLPVIIQPGQAQGTFGVALGYGRKLSGPVGDDVGVNAYSMLNSNSKYQNLSK